MPESLSDLLEQYRAGLQAEITLLQRLDGVAARQRAETQARRLSAVTAASDERSSIMNSLLTIEDTLSVIRQELIARRQHAQALEAYREVVALRKTATELIERILASDREAIKVLADAELARRAANVKLEQGETTLAAYRRVLGTRASATLVDRRG